MNFGAKDDLGDRIKMYEGITRTYLMPKSYVVIRIDGKSFHTFTRKFKKPFDDDLMDMMNRTAIALCKDIQGAKLAYVQSDEISILVSDISDNDNTSAWFDNNLQKMVSVSASIATAEFNAAHSFWRLSRALSITNTSPLTMEDESTAKFDSRVFQLPNITEVNNYFLWRCQDCSRNSVQMLARSLYSHNDCEDKNNSELQEMTWARGSNWNDLPAKYKRGRLIGRFAEPKTVEYNGKTVTVLRNSWKVKDLEGFSYEYWANIISNEWNYNRDKTLEPF